MGKGTHPFSDVIRKGFREGAVFGWLLQRNRVQQVDHEGAGIPYHFRPDTGTPVPFAFFSPALLWAPVVSVFVWTTHYGLAPSAFSVPFYLLGLTTTN